DVAAGPARVGSATLGAHVFGLVRDPSLETTLAAGDLHIASRAFPRAGGKNSGALRSPPGEHLLAPRRETPLAAAALHIASRAFPRAEGKSSGPLRSQQVDILVAGAGAGAPDL